MLRCKLPWIVSSFHCRNILPGQFIHSLIEIITEHMRQAVNGIVRPPDVGVVVIPLVGIRLDTKARKIFHVIVPSSLLDFVAAALKIRKQISGAGGFFQFFKFGFYHNGTPFMGSLSLNNERLR